jgi:hypothetical protein
MGPCPWRSFREEASDSAGLGVLSNIVRYGVASYGGGHNRTEGKLVAAYIVFTREKMRNPQEFKLYQEGPRPDPTAHPLEVLGFTEKSRRSKAVDGRRCHSKISDGRRRERLVLEPVYQDVARHSFLGADYRVFVVEGP